MKVEEAKGGDGAVTRDKWGVMEVDGCILTEEKRVMWENRSGMEAIDKA